MWRSSDVVSQIAARRAFKVEKVRHRRSVSLPEGPGPVIAIFGKGRGFRKKAET